MTASATSDDVAQFLATTTFSGYQAVPLPHGFAVPGRDLTARIEQVFQIPVQGRSYLEVGAYYGAFLAAAVERGASRAVGLEPSEERFAIASTIAALNGNAWEIRRCTVEELGRGETFDVVTFLNVLHHVRDPLEAVRKLVEVCTDTLVVEFCRPDDPQMLVHLYGTAGRPRRLNRWRARARSLALRAVARGLPLSAVGNWPHHRGFYLTPEAFENLFCAHLGYFRSVRFESAAGGGRRVVAFCRVAAPGRREAQLQSDEGE